MFLSMPCSSVCLPFNLFVYPDGKLRRSGNDAYFNGFVALKWVLKRRYFEWRLWETLISDTILNELKYQKKASLFRRRILNDISVFSKAKHHHLENIPHYFESLTLHAPVPISSKGHV